MVSLSNPRYRFSGNIQPLIQCVESEVMTPEGKWRPSWNSRLIDSPICDATIRVIIKRSLPPSCRVSLSISGHNCYATANDVLATVCECVVSHKVCWFYTQYISGCTPCRFQNLHNELFPLRNLYEWVALKFLRVVSDNRKRLVFENYLFRWYIRC